MALRCDSDVGTHILLYFVQDGFTSSKEMRQAFTLCQESKFKPSIICADDVRDIELNKKVVFILEEFKGEVFEYLASKECLVVGPSCIVYCINEKIPIPDNNSPVFNTALRGVVVTASKLSKSDKERIQQLVGFMGGIYIDQLTLAVTYLIADRVTPGKCDKAVEHSIPILGSSWIQAVWAASQAGGQPPEPAAYRLPPFAGMHITCSNLSQNVKKKLQTIIEANGGIYLRTLEYNKTVVLVIGEADGKKWAFAQEWEIPCVAPSWIYESAEKGVAVQSQPHLVAVRPKCSTPTLPGGDQNSFLSCSDISIVPHPLEHSKIDESNMSVASTASVGSVVRTGGVCYRTPAPAAAPAHLAPSLSQYKKLLKELKIKDVKNSGLFLDGCKIYLSGFSGQELEKLKKIVNYSGATIFSQITDRLTHVIAGEFSTTDAKELAALTQRPHIVTLDWLLHSMQEARPASVDPFLCLQSNPAPPASPLSHKGLKLLKSHKDGDSLGDTPHSESKVAVSRKLFVKAKKIIRNPYETPEKTNMMNSIDVSALERRAQKEMQREKEDAERRENEMETERRAVEEERREAVKRKSREEAAAARVEERRVGEEGGGVGGEERTDHQDDSNLEPFFQGVTFEMCGYEDIDQIKESIEAVGGRVLVEGGSGGDQPHYGIVPIEGWSQPLRAKQVVTMIFLEDCYERGCLIPDEELAYCHKPLPALARLPLLEKAPLSEAVLGLSGFGRAERRFLTFVASELGANVQEMFSRNDHPDKGVKRSTHLLSKEETGKKYEAALKWNIPVVGWEWLLNMVQETVGAVQTDTSMQVEEDHRSLAALSQEEKEEVAALSEMETSIRQAMNEPFELPEVTPPTTRRMSVPASAGRSPFHMDTPETPYGRAFTESTPSPTTRKKWKRWIEGFPDVYQGSPSMVPPKPKRLSTPMDVIKKQLWVKFGGVSFEGIQPSTGKILKNGPYGEWASGSEASQDNSLTSDNNVSVDGGKVLTEREGNVRDASSSGGPVDAVFFVAELKEKLLRHKTENTPPAVCNSESAALREFKKRASFDNDDEAKSDCYGHEDDGTPRSPPQVVAWDFQLPPGPAPKGLKELQDSVGTKSPAEGTQLMADEEKLTVDEKSKVFLLSGLSVGARQKYEGIIRQLGGVVSQTPFYDPTTTHLLIERPVRSEKPLCCIASGKWILHTSYLDSCYEARRFLPEEEFEWGNERAMCRLPQLKIGSTEAGIAAAGHRWRVRRQDMGSAAAFRDFKVALFTAESKMQPFRRLLEAGGATILEPKDVLSASHVVWEEGKCSLPVAMKELAVHQIHVVPPIYLGEYLVSTPAPSTHYPPQYRQIIIEVSASTTRR